MKHLAFALLFAAVAVPAAAQEAVAKGVFLARDLIKLYAVRKSQVGNAFSPDSYLQTELEASFIYEDTPDQGKATEDVKADMEQPHPMDRLVCGDVGFGKTEVAIRAAFKAACDGKQVAVLVPTTVLAQQHYATFAERFAPYPIRVEVIPRRQPPRVQTRVRRRRTLRPLHFRLLQLDRAPHHVDDVDPGEQVLDE